MKFYLRKTYKENTLRQIRAKLKTDSGASVVMALFLLLLASLVSVVIIQAAGSAVRIVRSDREQQQAYLTVTSAAQYMVSEISNSAFKQIDKDSDKYEADDETDCAFSKLLIRGIEENGKLEEFTFYLIVLSNEDIVAPVKVNFSMSDYDITAEFCLADDTVTGKEPESNYYLTMTFSGTSSKTSEDLKMVSWVDSDWKIEKQEAEKSAEDS